MIELIDIKNQMTIQNTMYSHGAKKAKDKKKDVYYTPTWFHSQLPAIFGDSTYYDPCPGIRPSVAFKVVSEETHPLWGKYKNGLETNWNDIGLPVFCNPPFSEMEDWLNKISLEADQDVTTLYFGKLDYRTKWGVNLSNISDVLLPVLGYVQYEDQDSTPHLSATFQSCVALFGKDSQKYKAEVLQLFPTRFLNK